MNTYTNNSRNYRKQLNNLKVTSSVSIGKQVFDENNLVACNVPRRMSLGYSTEPMDRYFPRGDRGIAESACFSLAGHIHICMYLGQTELYFPTKPKVCEFNIKVTHFWLSGEVL